MQFLEERPPELRQEIFDLLFETAEIATFTPEDKVKYEFDTNFPVHLPESRPGPFRE